MYQAVFFAFLSTVLGAMHYVALKLLANHLSFFDIGLLETGFLTVFFFLLEGWRVKVASWTSLFYLAVGAILHAGAAFFFYFSIKFLMPTELSLLNRNQFVFSIILGVIFLKERPSTGQWAAIITASLGSLLFIYNKIHPNNTAVLCALMCCLLFSTRTLLLKKSLGLHIRSQLFWGYFMSFIMMAIVAKILRGSAFPVLTMQYLQYGAVTCLSAWIFIGAGLAFYFQAIKKSTLAYASSTRALLPLFVAIFSSLFFSFEWTTHNLVGGGLCCISIFLFLYEGWIQRRTDYLNKDVSSIIEDEKFIET